MKIQQQTFFVLSVIVLFTIKMNAQTKKIKKNEETFVVNANIDNWPTTKVYLQYWYNEDKIFDSATVINGHFSFRGKVGDPVLAYVYTRPKELYPIRAFYLENTEIQVNGNFKNPQEWVIKGSKTQNEVRDLKEKHFVWKQQKDSLSYLWKKSDSANKFLIAKELDKANKGFDSITTSYILDNPKSYISLYNIPSLYFIKSLDQISGLYDGLDQNIRHSYYGEIIHKKINSMKSVQIGNFAPDFSLPDTTGKLVHLSDFRGKYVLLDFWASWCAPCRAENPNVKKNYEIFKDRNFTVLGVSLDRDGERMRWVQAINNDKMPWTQLSDLKEFSSPVALTYGIEAIPSNFLIDPNGKIIAMNLRGAKLNNELNQLFESK